MYVIVYDFGTSAVKTSLFDISSVVQMICHSNAEYGLYILDNGGAEQDTEEWWNAVTASTKELFKKTDIKPAEIAGLSFCTQMQGVVLVDKEGKALRRPMSYLDTRAVNEFKAGLGNGDEIHICRSPHDALLVRFSRERNYFELLKGKLSQWSL